ncbi:MAG: hypothetical protein ACI89S_001144 [Gammaproteobacteria bacterium]|jgi:hypothetical protein
MINNLQLSMHYKRNKTADGTGVQKGTSGGFYKRKANPSSEVVFLNSELVIELFPKRNSLTISPCNAVPWNICSINVFRCVLEVAVKLNRETETNEIGKNLPVMWHANAHRERHEMVLGKFQCAPGHLTEVAV